MTSCKFDLTKDIGAAKSAVQFVDGHRMLRDTFGSLLPCLGHMHSFITEAPQEIKYMADNSLHAAEVPSIGSALLTASFPEKAELMNFICQHWVQGLCALAKHDKEL